MENELYKNLGEAKSREVFRKYMTLSNLYEMAKHRTRNPQVAGKVYEGIAKDFISEFLPAGYKIKGGLIFNVDEKKLSPEIDAIIYRGVPFLEFTDAVIAEKNQVEAILEIKSWIGSADIFGEMNKKTGNRDANSGLLNKFQERRLFIQPTAKYVLFSFTLGSNAKNNIITSRLESICDMYAIISRKKIGHRWSNDADFEYNFDESVSGLIRYLRSLG